MLYRHRTSGGVIDADESQREHLIHAGFEPIEQEKPEKPKPEAPPTRKKQVRKEV